MDDEIANISKTTKRLQREVAITQHLANICSKNVPEIENEVHKLQDIDDKLVNQVTRDVAKEQIKTYIEKRQRQEQRQIGRFNKEVEERKRQRALEQLRQEWEKEQEEKLRIEEEEKAEELAKSQKKAKRGKSKGGSKKTTRSSTRESRKDSAKGSKNRSKKGSKKTTKDKAEKKSPDDKKEPKRGSKKSSRKGSKKQSRNVSNIDLKRESENEENKELDTEPKIAQFPECYSETELNRMLAEIMGGLEEPEIGAPPKWPKNRWTDAQRDEWLETCDRRLLFEGAQEEGESENVSELDYFLKAIDTHERLNRDAEDLDDYFTQTYMKPEPVEDFESDITSNLFSVPAEKDVDDDKTEWKYPLTYVTKLKHAFQGKQDLAIERSKAEDDLEKRLKSLQELKKHMDQEKRAFLCHKDERDQRKKMQREQLAKRLLQDLGINLSNSPEASNCVVDKYLKLQKERHMFESRQIEHRINILKRLLEEEKKKQSLRKTIVSEDSTLPSKSTHKVPYFVKKTSDDWSKDFITPEHDMTLSSENTSFAEDIEEEEEEEDRKILPIEVKAKYTVTKLRKPKKSRETVSSKKKKSKSGSKKKERKKSKSKDRKSTKKLKEPEIEREYVKPEDTSFAELHIYKTCDEMDEHFVENEFSSESLCQINKNTRFSWKPTEIEFKNFQVDRIYRQRVVVTNTSTQWLSCYMQKFELNDPIQKGIFELRNMFPQRICAGLSFDFTIIFKPTAKTTELIGKLIFIVSSDETEKLEYFCIPIYCSPLDFIEFIPKLVPTEIKFIDVPEWGNSQQKILKLVNSSDIYYTASISQFERSFINDDSLEITDIDFEEKDPKGKGKKKKDKSKEIELKNKFNAVKSIIDECLEETVEIFRFQPRHYIEIPPKCMASIKVKFHPLPSGIYNNKYSVHFESTDRTCVSEVMLPVSANTVAFPLYVDPIVVSFNTCLFDSDTYQAQFLVINKSNVAVQLVSSVPRELHNQAQIIPSEIYVQPASSSSFSVRLMPKLNLRKTAQKYYKNDIEVLDFPASIQPTHKVFGQCPVLSVQILAVVTSPYALEISPSNCNLGVVSTQETACKAFTLINRSNAWLNYAFLKSPECVQIQPNYGVGIIGPREHKKFHLLYSPKVHDIDGNKSLQRFGISGFHKFYVRVVTSAMQAGSEEYSGKSAQDILRKEYIRDFFDSAYMTFHDRKSLTDVEETQSIFSDVPTDNVSFTKKRTSKEEKKKENDNKELTVDSTIQEKSFESKTDSKDNHLLLNMTDLLKVNESPVIELEEESEDSLEDEEYLYNMSEENSLKNIMLCQAYVLDTLCELSHTRLILPATPCGSYSLSIFHLLGYNKTSNPDCECGILTSWNEKIKNFDARFEFHSSIPQLTIEPNCGHFCAGQEVKIIAVFKPVLPQTAVEAQVQRLKAQLILEKRKVAEKEPKTKTEKKNKKTASISKKGKRSRSKSSNETKEEKKVIKESIDRSSKSKENNSKTDENIEPEKISITESDIQTIINKEKIEITPEDILPAEKALLEILQPYFMLAKVKCLIEILNISGVNSSRCEVHRMDILCPVTKPNIVLLDTSQHVKFGPVAIGIRSCQVLRIQNMTQEHVTVSTSLLNPVGPFTCPSSATIVAPEHVFLLPLTFLPWQESEEEAEFFEVHSGKTIIPIKVSGEGVVPNYLITPDFLVFRFDYKKNLGKSRESCVIEIQNNCTAPLPFQLVEEIVAQTEEKPDTESPEKEGDENMSEIDTSKKKSKKKKSKKKAPKKKVITLKQFDTELLPREISMLAENDFGINVFQSPFLVESVSQGNELIIPPMDKSSFIVKFCLPDKGSAISGGKTSRDVSQSQAKVDIKKNNEIDSSKTSDKNKRSSKGLSDNTRNSENVIDTSEPNQEMSVEKRFHYAAKFSLILGKTMNVRDFFFTVSPSVKIDSKSK